MGNVEKMFEKDISDTLIDFFGKGKEGTYRAGLQWLHAKNPHLNNTLPAKFANKGNHETVLDYVKKNMDPKVRARCLKYKSEVRI